MRLRLLRRRLTISSPRMSVRSAMPWPLRWLGMAVMLGFSAAVALWAFELGKSIAGVNSADKEELIALRTEAQRLRDERDQAQSVANTSGSLLTTERAAQERLASQLRALEAENRALRGDLGFFEKLIPTGGSEAVAIRALQAEPIAEGQIRWQVLVIQPSKNAPEFQGKLELTFSGLLDGKPWNLSPPTGAQPLRFRQYQRAEGVIDVPPSAVVQNVSARVVEGTAVKATYNIKL